MLIRVGDLLVAAHLPLAHRCDNPQLWCQRGDGGLNPHLIVALAGTAVGDGVAAVTPRLVNSQLGDERTSQRREQGVAALVARVRLDCRGHVVTGELLARVDDQALDGAQVGRLLEDLGEVVLRLAKIDAQRHDLGVVLILDPLEHHRCVETTRVEQHDTVHLMWQGEVLGGLLDGRHF